MRLSWKRQQFSFKNICKNHYFKFVNQKKLKLKTVTQPWAFPGQRSVMYLKFVLDNDFTYLYKWPFYIYILQYLFFCVAGQNVEQFFIFGMLFYLLKSVNMDQVRGQRRKSFSSHQILWGKNWRDFFGHLQILTKFFLLLQSARQTKFILH